MPFGIQKLKRLCSYGVAAVLVLSVERVRACGTGGGSEGVLEATCQGSRLATRLSQIPQRLDNRIVMPLDEGVVRLPHNTELKVQSVTAIKVGHDSVPQRPTLRTCVDTPSNKSPLRISRAVNDYEDPFPQGVCKNWL